MGISSWTLRAGTATWSTGADWAPNAPAPGDTVTIGSAADSGNVLVTQDTSIAVNGLTLSAPTAGGFTTTLALTPGGALSVAGAIHLGNNTIVNGTGTLVANGAITGGTIAASSGLLALSGTGRIASGATSLSIGTLAPSTLSLNLSGGVTVGAIAINSANQILEIGAAGALTLNRVESITNGLIQIDGGKLTDASGLVVGAGATVKGRGTITAAVSGTGVVEASGGELLLARAASTGPSYLIDTSAGSTLRLNAAAAAGASFSFMGSAGTLELANVSAGTVRNFAGNITGLAVGASATVPTNDVNIQATVTTARLSGSQITVLNGTTTVASLNLSAAPIAGAYAVVRADAALGGYDVFLSNAVVPAPTVTWSPATTVGTEGSAIKLGTLTPSGSVALASVLVTGIPIGAKLADGTHSFTAAAGSTSVNVLGWNYAALRITPAGDANIALAAQVTDAASNVSTLASEVVTVAPLAPAVAPAAVAGQAGLPIALNLGIAAAQLPGDANKLSSVTIGAVPTGATFSNTNHDTLTPVTGRLTLSAAQLAAGVLNGLSITLAQGGSFNLSVAAAEQDAEGDTSAMATGSETIAANGRTIGSAVAGPIVLGAADNPLTITSAGSITATTASADGVDGPAGTAWTIVNAGAVKSSAGSGVVLNSGGSVGNTGSIAAAKGIVVQGGAGAISNSGTIAATVSDGVDLNAGGTVINNAGGTISGYGTSGAAIFISGGMAAITNNGSLTGNQHEGVLIQAGGTVTNGATGVISAQDAGVFTKIQSGNVSNYGQISGTGPQGTGVYLENNGSVTNATGASITGAKFGAFIEGGAGTLTNYGTIVGGQYDGVIMGLGGTVTNAAGGSIRGVTGGVYGKYRAAVTVTNSGSIATTGTTGAAIDLADGGTFTNNVGGTVSGADHGVFIVQAAGTVNNTGSISGSRYHGVHLGAGGTAVNAAGATVIGGTAGVYVGKAPNGSVSNAGVIMATASGAPEPIWRTAAPSANGAGGSISGGGFGVFITGAAGAVTNAGTIAGAHGVALQAGGSVVNDANATIQGQVAGIFTQAGAATLTNSGSIAATVAGGAGADIEGGGTVTNNAGATLSGSAFGVFLTGGGTVINAGTIGGASYAVKFGGSGTNNRLVVEAGAVLNGAVGGASGGTNALEFAGGAGTLSNVAGGSGSVTQGSQSWSFFGGFSTIAVDAGANWTVSGTNGIANVSNAGTVAVLGSLDITSAIDAASSGLFQLGSGATLETAAALGSATQIAFIGPSTLSVDDFAAFGTSSGTLSYAGPQLQAFRQATRST